MSSINSIYSLSGMSIDYVANGAAWRHMVACKKAVAKAKHKAGIVHHQWPICGTTTYKRTKTMLAVRGAYVNGSYTKEVYMKQWDLMTKEERAVFAAKAETKAKAENDVTYQHIARLWAWRAQQ